MKDKKFFKIYKGGVFKHYQNPVSKEKKFITQKNFRIRWGSPKVNSYRYSEEYRQSMNGKVETVQRGTKQTQKQKNAFLKEQSEEFEKQYTKEKIGWIK